MRKLLTAVLICASSLALAHDQSHGHGGSGSQAVFDKSKAFQLRGTLEDSAPGEITIARPGNLPDVDLDVVGETRFILDGRQVEAGEIPEGTPVQASFQVSGDDLMAVEIRGYTQGQQQQQQQQQPQQQQ